MNKTYRSVCNEARGAWVAASELGGDRRKGAQRAAVGVALMLLAMGAAQGQVKIGNNPTTINPGSALEIETPIRASGAGERHPVVTCVGSVATPELVRCLQPNRRVDIDVVTAP